MSHTMDDGTKIRSFENFTSECQVAIERFRKEFPLELIRDFRDDCVKLYHESRNEMPLSSANKECYRNIYLNPWEYAAWLLCRGYLMGCGVSRSESYDAAYFVLKNNFWL